MAKDEEESEFDREDAHEHTPACGHTSEEHEKQKEKIERVSANFKKFLAENAGDLMDDEVYQKLKTKIHKRLQKQGLSTSVSALKVFREGFEFAMMCHINVEGEIPPIFAGINKMVMERESATPKIPIDITKSKPLTDEAE